MIDGRPAPAGFGRRGLALPADRGEAGGAPAASADPWRTLTPSGRLTAEAAMAPPRAHPLRLDPPPVARGDDAADEPLHVRMVVGTARWWEDQRRAAQARRSAPAEETGGLSTGQKLFRLTLAFSGPIGWIILFLLPVPAPRGRRFPPAG